MNQLPWWEPQQLAQALVRCFGSEGFVWLDGDGSPLGNRVLLAVAPQTQIRCSGLPGEPGSKDPFKALQEIQANRNGCWLGWLAYEAGAWVETSPHWQTPDMATLWAGCYGAVVHLDLEKQKLWLTGEAKYQKPLEALLRSKPTTADQQQPTVNAGIGLDAWYWHTTTSAFEQQVNKVKESIKAGDIFQANLSVCAEYTLPANADPLAMYQRLRSKCPAPFGGLIIASNQEAVLSASPERFISCDQEGNVETRPIKGTRPRHQEQDNDAAAAAELITSAKDRAENIMIVDLLRNDLGRVCKAGSIKVPQLLG
ncbi:chorismate-binding protein, partial [Synechococcus sp. Cruz CV12-2-Slac-r]|uniref:chorismate-binding protein n=1 Tax=Synechococcus sp. Cruz CV12-2-Slac-r TaxID=2823748 RepID=UPI0020CD8477